MKNISPPSHQKVRLPFLALSVILLDSSWLSLLRHYPPVLVLGLFLSRIHQSGHKQLHDPKDTPS